MKKIHEYTTSVWAIFLYTFTKHRRIHERVKHVRNWTKLLESLEIGFSLTKKGVFLAGIFFLKNNMLRIVWIREAFMADIAS